MAVSKEDREAYEKGLEDSKMGPLEAIIGGVIGGLSLGLGERHRSDSEEAAYQKGLKGEQLDKDND